MCILGTRHAVDIYDILDVAVLCQPHHKNLNLQFLTSKNVDIPGMRKEIVLSQDGGQLILFPFLYLIMRR